MVGSWGISSRGSADGDQRYVVAARPIGPGQRLSAGDLRSLPLDLPPTLRRAAITDAADAVGAVALGPMAAGELVQAGALADPAGAPDEREISFVVETDWAVAGTLRVGDRIDVFATDEAPGGRAATRVLADATVRSIGAAGGDRLGERRTQTITVAVAGRDDAAALVAAARTSTLTVLRVTGTLDRGRRSGGGR